MSQPSEEILKVRDLFLALTLYFSYLSSDLNLKLYTIIASYVTYPVITNEEQLYSFFNEFKSLASPELMNELNLMTNEELGFVNAPDTIKDKPNKIPAAIGKLIEFYENYFEELKSELNNQ